MSLTVLGEGGVLQLQEEEPQQQPRSGCSHVGPMEDSLWEPSRRFSPFIHVQVESRRITACLLGKQGGGRMERFHRLTDGTQTLLQPRQKS